MASGPSFYSAFSVQMMLEVSCHIDSLIDDEEGVRRNFLGLLPQGIQLVLVQAGAKNINRLPRIGARSLPAGNTPVQLLQDELRQFFLLVPGQDQKLHGNSLLVDAVHKQGAEHRVNGRINSCGGSRLMVYFSFGALSKIFSTFPINPPEPLVCPRLYSRLIAQAMY